MFRFLDLLIASDDGFRTHRRRTFEIRPLVYRVDAVAAIVFLCRFVRVTIEYGPVIQSYFTKNRINDFRTEPLCTFLTFILKIHANRECKAPTSRVPLRFFVLSDAVFHEFHTDNRYVFTRFSKRFDESDRTRPSSAVSGGGGNPSLFGYFFCRSEQRADFPTT